MKAHFFWAMMSFWLGTFLISPTASICRGKYFQCASLFKHLVGDVALHIFIFNINNVVKSISTWYNKTLSRDSTQDIDKKLNQLEKSWFLCPYASSYNISGRCKKALGDFHPRSWRKQCHLVQTNQGLS